MPTLPTDDPELVMPPEADRQQWEAYLHAMQAEAEHEALRNAILAPEDATPPPGYRRGSGNLHIVFHPPRAATPWAMEKADTDPPDSDA